VNLYLELRNRVSLYEVLSEIVSFVHLLHCFLKLYQTNFNCLKELTIVIYSEG